MTSRHPQGQRFPSGLPAQRSAPNVLRPLSRKVLASLEAACTRGWALPEPWRRRFERAFGAELGNVRVHEHALVTELGAESLCWGEHLLFAPGAMAPDTAHGAFVLAHELVHVLQQRAGRVAAGDRPSLVVDATLEEEADRLAELALAGERAALPGLVARRGVRGPSLALQPYQVILNAQFANHDIDLHNATFEGQEDGLRPHPYPKTQADSFLIDTGQLNVVVKPHNQINLRVSHDGEMAIEDTDLHHRQPKHFFATDTVISRCNSSLRSVGSSYRIAKVAGPKYIEIGPPAQGCLAFMGVGGPKRLYQVTMSENGNLDPAVSQNCNEISGKAMGEQRDTHRTIKLKQPGNQLFNNLPRWQLGGWVPNFPTHGDIAMRMAKLITTYLFNGQNDGQNAAAARQAAAVDYQNVLAQALVGANNPNAMLAALAGVYGPIGRNYGRLVNRVRAQASLTLNGVNIQGLQLRQRFEQLIFRLGINAYAEARIGDAFQTYSVGAVERYQDPQGRTWLRMRDEVAPRPHAVIPQVIYCAPVWEYHWGSVVAESGADRITFENYARNYEDRAGPQLNGQEQRSFFQMTRVPTQLNDPLIAQSWHESCYAYGFANAMTLAVSKISRCGR